MRFLTVSLLASSVLFSTQADALSFRDAHFGTPIESAFKKIRPQLKSSRAREDALRRAAPKPKTYDDHLKDLQSRVDKAPRIGRQKERRVNLALANELITFAEQAKSKRKWGHAIWALESAYSVADARQKPTIQSKITSTRQSGNKWAWDYEIAPQVDHALKVLANRHVRKVMPKDQQKQLAQRITCIMDTGMYDLQFARSEIGRVREELKIYKDFLPCAGFEDQMNGQRLWHTELCATMVQRLEDDKKWLL